MIYYSYDNFDGYCQPSNLDFIDSLRNASTNLSSATHYSHFDLNSANEAISQLENDPSKNSCWFNACLNCNDFENQIQALSDCIAASVSNESSAIEQAVATVIKLVNDVKLAIGRQNDYTLVQFRTTTVGNSASDSTWHTDSLYKDFAHRVVIPFKGNPTIFYPLPNEMRETFNNLDEDGEYQEINNMIDSNLVEQPTPGQGTIFYNLEDNAAVHAAPKMEGGLGSTRIVLIVDIANKEVLEAHNLELAANAPDGEIGKTHIINQTPSC